MLRAHIFRTILFTFIGLGIALLAAFISPKIYESRLEMLVNDATRQGITNNGIFTPDVEDILRKGQAEGATTERQLLSSQSVFYQALAKVDDAKSRRGDLVSQFADLYPLYDIETARNTNTQVDAGVLLLKVRAKSADDAAAIADQIGRVYDEIRVRNARESVQQALNYLSNQIEAAKKNLDGAASSVENYKRTNQISDLGKDLQDATAIMTNLVQRSQALKAELSGSEAEVRVLKNELANAPKYEEMSAQEMRSPLIGQYEAELASLQARRATLLGQYYEDAKQVKDIDESIKIIQNKLAEVKKNPGTFGGTSKQPKALRSKLEQDVAAASARRDNLAAQSASVESQIETQKQLIGALPKKEAELTKLLRELRVFEDQYQRVKTMREDLTNRSQTAQRAALVLNKAQPDDVPVAPDIKKFAIAGAAAGMCLGLLVSFLMESLKLRIQSSTQLTALTGLPVVAAIPSKQKSGAKALRQMSIPGSLPPEAFRYMAFSLVTNNTKTMRTFMFTGIRTALTTYASALQFAVAAAKGGSRVLLVDADMLKSPITKSLDAGGKDGLSNLLTADLGTDAKNYIVDTVHPNLRLLPGGTDPSAKFLTNVDQPKLEAVMQALRLSADVIIIAVPPCDVLADASTVARHVDDVCLVVSAAQTNYRSVPLAQDLLNKAGAKNISLVMTDASAEEEPFAKSSAYLARS